jgi:hypothetical protein
MVSIADTGILPEKQELERCFADYTDSEIKGISWLVRSGFSIHNEWSIAWQRNLWI